jgi:hypothetical protein
MEYYISKYKNKFVSLYLKKSEKRTWTIFISVYHFKMYFT